VTHYVQGERALVMTMSNSQHIRTKAGKTDKIVPVIFL
jgi:hypothetical protein